MSGRSTKRWLFASLLMADPYLEVKSLGIEVVVRYRREFTPRLLPMWKRWLARDQSTNWATTDAISCYLIGPLLLRYPELAPGMREWAGTATCGFAARRRPA
jgi:hypothetical protein